MAKAKCKKKFVVYGRLQERINFLITKKESEGLYD